MVRKISYLFEECPKQEDYYDYTVYENIADIERYEYEKTFRIDFNELSWYLTEGALDLFKTLEKKWFENTLDTYEYYSDPEFSTWLYNRYYYEALHEYKIKYRYKKL